VVVIVPIHKAPERSAHSNTSRSTESATFLKRALSFQTALKKREFPNATTLAVMCSCSRSTAMRTIDRLRYEFGMPIEYDESQRGYFLTRHDFIFNQLPLDRGELVALLVICELASLIDDNSLQASTNSLWAKMTNGRTDCGQELERLRGRLCLDPVLIAKLCGVSLVELLTLCHRSQLVRVNYQVPWPESLSPYRVGFLEKVYFSEGALKVMFRSALGQQILLHASCITSLEELQEIPEHVEGGDVQGLGKSHQSPNSELGTEEETGMVEISIVAPAAQFFAMQRWHAEQEDTWHGSTLTRRFPGAISADVARRVLGVGRFLESVRPPELLDKIFLDVSHLWSLCSAERRRT
jgi:hypothetical protein